MVIVGDARPEAGLLEQLPPPLPADQVVALNTPRVELLSTHREYSWNGWRFDVPPGVCLPGLTSRMIFDRVLDGTIEVRARRYLAMGCGLGVEAVAAGARGAAAVYAVDVHPESVQATERHYRRLVDDQTVTAFMPVVADLLDGVPDGLAADVITFNPPAVSQRVSDDADVVRNVCVGAPLLARFFAQLAARGLPAPGGEVFVVLSNTAEMRVIVENAIRHGFRPEIAYLKDWNDGLLTYLFRFTTGGCG